MEKNSNNKIFKIDLNCFFLYFLLIIFITFFSCDFNEIIDNQIPFTNESNQKQIDNSRFKYNNCNNKNIKIVDKFYKRFKKGNIGSIIALFSYDATLFINGQPGKVPLAGTYIGKNAITEYFMNFQEKIVIHAIELQYNLNSNTIVSSHVAIELQYNLNSNTIVSSHVNLIATVCETGKTFDLEYVYLFEINNKHKINKLTVLYDTYLFFESFGSADIQYLTDLKVLTDDYSVNEVSYDSEAIVRLAYSNFQQGDLNGVWAGH